VVLVAEHDELLELPRLAMEPVKPPDHHAVALTCLDIGQKALIFTAGLLVVESADVVVEIDASDDPAASVRLFEAVGLLALDA
jgi:hypothetical protein